MALGDGVKELTASDRIAQLNDIDRDVAKLLHSAGLAVKALTSAAGGQKESGEETSKHSLEQRQETFAAESSRYFSTLSSVDVRLRRQVTALEKAAIIPSEVTTKGSQTNQSLGEPTSSQSTSPSFRSQVAGKDMFTNGGLGNLDVSWLNSRNNIVEKEMEAELWDKAEVLVQRLSEAKAGGGDSGDISMTDETLASTR
ncbi:MAG: hypothetical protein Q9183_001870 [Haloplaca sp. 2 TL-2023]